MKKNILIALFFTSIFLFSQDKKITIVDSLTKEYIQYANVKNLESLQGTFSDSLGVFNIKKLESNKILISVLGYESKILYSENIRDSIFLKSKTIVLDEILINTNYKKDYGFHKKKGKFIGSSIKRSIIAVYIQNLEPHIDSHISSLHFKIKKRGKFISIIRPHIYTINDKTKMPDKELLNYNILIKEKRRGKKILTIDIADKNIIFPKEGVFIALEWVGNTTDIDFGYSQTEDKSIPSTLLTSLAFKQKIWVPFAPPSKKEKNTLANFGLTIMKIEN